jgi:hypothetical protein
MMKATLIWTINDFLAYGMVSGWSTHEKLTYSYCMENSKVFTLTNDDKTSFFTVTVGYHKFKKNKKNLFVRRIKRDVALPFLSVEELYDVVSKYGDIVFGFQFGK